MSVAVGVSVHSLTCYPVAAVRHPTQQKAPCCRTCSAATSSAPTACPSRRPAPTSSAISTRATPEADGSAYRLKGTKAWISHAGHADFYTRLRPHRRRPEQAACPASWSRPTPTASRSARPSARWACTATPCARCSFDGVAGRRRPAGRRRRARACRSPCPRWTPAGSASPLPQPAWPRRRSTSRRRYAKEREQFGRPIGDFQGLAFLLADMEAAVTSARARRTCTRPGCKDAGRPFSKQAAVAKLVCTDAR